MSFDPIKIKRIQPLGKTVIVSDMNFRERFLSSGIILLNDDGKSSGIRPRWAEVYAVGPEQQDVQPGQWICVAHGRWTRGVKIEDEAGIHTVRKIDTNDILLVSDEPVNTDDTISTAISGNAVSA